jgi:hypothetical protein
MAFQETKSHSYAHGMIRMPDGHSFGGVAKSDIIRTVVRQPDLQTGVLGHLEWSVNLHTGRHQG